MAGDLDPELVHRRVLARRVEEDREPGRVAVEVRPEQRPHPADRAVPLRLVEQLADVRAQRAPVAEEPLQRSRQAAVAVREVRPERLVECLRRPRVRLLRLAGRASRTPSGPGRRRPSRRRPAARAGRSAGRARRRPRGPPAPAPRGSRPGRVADDEPIDDDPLARRRGPRWSAAGRFVLPCAGSSAAPVTASVSRRLTVPQSPVNCSERIDASKTDSYWSPLSSVLT